MLFRLFFFAILFSVSLALPINGSPLPQGDVDIEGLKKKFVDYLPPTGVPFNTPPNAFPMQKFPPPPHEDLQRAFEEPGPHTPLNLPSNLSPSIFVSVGHTSLTSPASSPRPPPIASSSQKQPPFKIEDEKPSKWQVISLKYMEDETVHAGLFAVRLANKSIWNLSPVTEDNVSPNIQISPKWWMKRESKKVKAKNVINWKIKGNIFISYTEEIQKYWDTLIKSKDV